MIELNFLFWLFLEGIVIASLQDIKRREVDNWLNLFLIIGGGAYIIFNSIFLGEYFLILQFGFLLVIFFILMNLFYYGHIFAGGDAKLLFSMAPFFVAATFMEAVYNIGYFILFLMLAGSVYGIFYSAVLYFRNFKKVNGNFKKEFLNGNWKFYVICFGVIFLIGSFFYKPFLLPGVFITFFPLLYVFAKGLEEVVMIRIVSGKNLREGDWLLEDVRVGRKIIRANWDGLTKKDLKFLKDKKRVKIKDGIPFVPAFLIGFLIYVFFRNNFLEILLKIFG